ncbi:hypothetical protein MCAG_04529 [Micromonospora sp. ATCC 39149]|nr:hypothetical protein MCAG_04529 [Micromonospora sp. ATCC 39149]
MSAEVPISRLWPAPSAGLDDAELTALYGRADRPHLRVNFVTSVDGAVSLDGYSAGLSGEPDKRVFGLLRMLCDGLLVAAGTLRHEGYRAVRLDAPRRAWRREHGLAEYPTLVVVSGSLDLDPAQAAFADAPVRPVVLTHAAAEAPPRLAEVAELVRCGADRVDLAAGLASCAGAAFGQVLCEGGRTLFGAFTGRRLGQRGLPPRRSLLRGGGPRGGSPRGPPAGGELSLRHVLAAGGALLLRYARDAAAPAPAPPTASS